MEQTSLANKVVSLHLQSCSTECGNSSVCYFRKREKRYDINFLIKTRSSLLYPLLKKGIRVHESIMYLEMDSAIFLMSLFSNYNTTLSSSLINKTLIIPSLVKDQFQISVYTLKDIEKFRSFQKLFLMKDFQSLDLSLRILSGEINNIGKIHLLIDNCFIDARKSLLLIKMLEKNKDPRITLDRCLSGWLVNGHCPYKKDYIDINFDGTVRKCPYAKKGLVPKDLKLSTIERLLIEEIDHYKLDPEFICPYRGIFGGIK